jgi:general secretion pathway protein G
MKILGQSMSYRQQSGFTLIEVMVVVVILGILAAIVVPKIMSRPEQARMVKVRQDILAVQSALDLYKLDNGFYPSTEQGLQALIIEPSTDPRPRNWKAEGYLQELPTDPWSEPYQYINENERAKIFSYGPKGREGNTEIGNWNMNAKE